MKKTKLVIFDIDGTLTKTNELDNICFIDAIQQFINKDSQHFDANYMQADLAPL